MPTLTISQPDCNTALFISVMDKDKQVWIRIEQGSNDVCAIRLQGKDADQFHTFMLLQNEETVKTKKNEKVHVKECRKLISTIAKMCDVSTSLLYSNSKMREVVRCRRYCSLVLTYRYNLSHKEIAKLLKMKASSSIIWQLRYIRDHHKEEHPMLVKLAPLTKRPPSLG
jgi:chromosomal replication initiation ATPase DnaA